jgi:hypothetical protein
MHNASGPDPHSRKVKSIELAVTVLDEIGEAIAKP